MITFSKLSQTADSVFKLESPENDMPIFGFKRRLALGVMCLTILIGSLDTTILNIALPDLVLHLKATNVQLEWIVDSYAVVTAGLLIFAGSLGDRIGRKVLLVAGLIVFAIGSVLSAFSGSVLSLIIGRSIMGIGSACTMPATLALITSMFRRQSERALAIGIWSGTEGIGIALGPIAGGWLLAHFWWGSVFLINVPIAVIAAISAALLIPNYKSSKKIHSDIKGVILSVMGISLFLWGIIEAPLSGWFSASVIIPLIAGGFGMFLFMVWEFRAKHPMLDTRLFKKSRFSVALASEGLIIFVLMGLLFLMTQYLQFSLGFTPFAAGIRILPVAIILGVAAPISTFIDKYLGTKITVAGAMLIIALGCYMLSLTTIHSTYNDVLFGLIVVGLGSGLAFPPATEAVMGTLKSENTGVGSATNSAAMQLGGALGVGIIGTALTSRYQGNLSKVLMGHNIPPVALNAIKGSLGGALAVAHIAGGTSGKLLAAAANSAFISGMDLGLQVGSVVAVVAAVLIIGFLPSRNIHLNVPDTKDKLRRSEDSSSQSLKSTDKNRAKCIL